ncbi:hypothetical protein PAMA_008356 [Pampus argenteus]
MTVTGPTDPDGSDLHDLSTMCSFLSIHRSSSDELTAGRSRRSRLLRLSQKTESGFEYGAQGCNFSNKRFWITNPNPTPTLHLLYTYPTPTLHPLYTYSTPSLHPLYTYSTPTLHPLYTYSTPSLHPLRAVGPQINIVVHDSGGTQSGEKYRKKEEEEKRRRRGGEEEEEESRRRGREEEEERRRRREEERRRGGEEEERRKGGGEEKEKRSFWPASGCRFSSIHSSKSFQDLQPYEKPEACCEFKGRTMSLKGGIMIEPQYVAVKISAFSANAVLTKESPTSENKERDPLFTLRVIGRDVSYEVKDELQMDLGSE